LEEKGIFSKLRRGAVNWESPFPDGEDEASMKRHRETLFRRGSRGGEMGEFSPPFSEPPSFFFFLSLKN